MADQIKQIAFKEFTPTEIGAGTAWNAIQSGGNDAYVIKSIEATQKIDTTVGAITATATVGLTSDFSSGKYVSVGNIAKQGKTGSTGNIVVDANSTFTVRPTAKTIDFKDKTLHIDTENSTAPRKTRTQTEAAVNGVTDLNINADIDKTSVTMASPQNVYNTGYYQGNYTAFITNANGTPLKILFSSDNGDGLGFDLHNYNTGVRYGYMEASGGRNYAKLNFDGSRYIYWYYSNRIYYFDLDESDANLASANTMGGGNGHDYYHGYINFTGTPNSSQTTYDNHYGDICQKDGKTYMIWSGGSSKKGYMAELPSTLTNNNTTANVCPKWCELWYNQNTNLTDPFGATGCLSFHSIWASYGYGGHGGLQISYDTTLERFLVYLIDQSNRTYVGTFTQSNFDAVSNGSMMQQTNSAGGFGLVALKEASLASGLGFHSDFTNAVSGGTGYLYRNHIYNNSTGAPASWSFNENSEWFFDQRDIYVMNANSGVYNFHVYKVNLVTKALTDMTSAVSGAIANKEGRFFYRSAVPTNATIAGRNYSSAPALTVRISGVHENRA